MATCKDFDSGSDQITQICNYCSNVSDGYCHDCETFMCQTCFDNHTKTRPCRHHVLADNSSKPDKCSKTCARHPFQIIQFYCVDHELVGCIQCFFPDHRNCRFEEIQKAAEQFHQRGDDSRLKDKLHELESKHIEYRSQCDEDKESVEDMDTKVVKDVKSLKKDIIAFAKKVEAHALEEAERLRIDNETLVEKRISELDNVGENIEQCLVKLEKQPTADEFFIAAIEVKPEVEKLEKKLTSINSLGAVRKYIFTPSSDVVKMIQDVRSFGEIRTISDPIPDVATCVINKKSDDKSLEVCVICMDTVTVPKTIDCGHTFCKDCIDQQFQYQKKCPTCGKAYGIITGDQPYGTMSVDEDRNRHLPGYEGCGTIYITYKFNNGKQESHHPSPGKWYKGIIRTAYLPGNDEGWNVYKMLRVAFDRKLTFTIGNSRTTGQEGVITWNDIYHKTDHRHHTQFGYPDPTYLERVKDELAAKGITEEDITDM